MVFVDTPIEAIQDLVSPDQAALLIIDMQNDFCHPKGVIAKRGGDLTKTQPVPARLGAFLDYCRHHKPGPKIIHVVTHHSDWTNSDPWMRRYRSIPEQQRAICVPGTWGAEIYDGEPRLSPEAGEYLVIKHRYSAFVGTDLDLILKAQKVKTLWITGISTNVCVESTLRHGHMLDYHVILVRDLTASTDNSLYEATLQNTQKSFGYVITSEMLRASMR